MIQPSEIEHGHALNNGSTTGSGYLNLEDHLETDNDRVAILCPIRNMVEQKDVPRQLGI